MYEDEKKRFKDKHGYEPNLKNPKSFNEKVVYKKLFDRNPLITLTADKYRVRQYIRDRIGWEADNHLIPLLHVTKNPYTIPLNLMPKQFIIKPNNGAGRWIIVEEVNGKKRYTVDRIGVFYDLTQEQIANYCNAWFRTVHGSEWYEWAYQDIDPLIVVEQLLYDNGNIPHSYKFCMFNGKCKMIYVLNRNDIELRQYDEHFKPLKAAREGHPMGPVQEIPFRFKQMIDFAERLSNGFDFLRVDFYIVQSYVYFGELTHYPGSGHGVWNPKEYDLELGKYWKVGSGTYDKYL